MIPSSRGSFGAQEGKKNRPPIPMIVDPDRPDGGIVITPDMLDDSAKIQTTMSQQDSASGVYEELSKGGSVARKKAELDSAQPIDTFTPKRGRGRPPLKTPQAAPVPVAVSKPAVDVTDTAEQAVADALNAQMPSIVSVIASTVQKQLAGLGGALPSPVASAQAAAPQPGQAKAAPVVNKQVPEYGMQYGPEAPKVTVELSGEGKPLTCIRFHEVISQENSGVLVLVYNLGYKYGDRIYPATDPERPYQVLIRKDDGTVMHSTTALYMGLRFIHNNFEYQILLVKKS